MSVDQKLVKQIFIEVLGRESPGDRRAYLDESCGSDPQLREAVEQFLESHEQMGEFLDDSPADRLPDPLVSSDNGLEREGPGTVIDRYKLLERIGEGGFVCSDVFRCQSYPAQSQGIHFHLDDLVYRF